MNVNRTINGFKVTVKKWDNKVTVTRIADGQEVVSEFIRIKVKELRWSVF